MGAQEAIQARIDAQQVYDAIEYGRRTREYLGARGRRYYKLAEDRAETDWAAVQLAAARVACEAVGEVGCDLWHLRKAKKTAMARLKAAKAAEKAIGTKRQLRLALAA